MSVETPGGGTRGGNNRMMMDLTNAVVQILGQYLGRGPTRARSHLSENVLTVITQDNLTQAERQLRDADEQETVRGMRRKFQSAMSEDLIATVEERTGRRVVAFLSDHDPNTDYAAEVFVLDGEPNL
jgi:uncharacterized protein YbcI